MYSCFESYQKQNNYHLFEKIYVTITQALTENGKRDPVYKSLQRIFLFWSILTKFSKIYVDLDLLIINVIYINVPFDVF